MPTDIQTLIDKQQAKIATLQTRIRTLQNNIHHKIKVEYHQTRLHQQQDLLRHHEAQLAHLLKRQAQLPKILQELKNRAHHDAIESELKRKRDALKRAEKKARLQANKSTPHQTQ